MSPYIWSWSDEYENHVNSADSLEDIASEVLESYFPNAFLLDIKITDGAMDIEIQESGENLKQFKINATSSKLATLLESIANDLERPDLFDIWLADELP